MPGDPPASQIPQISGVTIPPEISAAFPVLIDLIMHSESMNDEERQYWIDILPIMTPDQVQQLQTILQNEREQLAAIDAKYQAELQATAATQAPLQQIEETRRARKSELSSKEQASRKEEEDRAERILKEIE